MGDNNWSNLSNSDQPNASNNSLYGYVRQAVPAGTDNENVADILQDFPSGRFRLYHAEARFQTADQRQTCQIRDVVFWICGQLPKDLAEAVVKVRVAVIKP